MALDLNSLLLGLVVAGVPLLAFIWQLQRRVSAHNAELALLDERLKSTPLDPMLIHTIFRESAS